MKKIIQLCFFLIINSFITTAFASPAAMVTDKQGKVDIAGSELPLFLELETGTLLKMSAQSKMTLVYLDSGKEYSLQGPLSVTIGKDSPSADQKTIKASNELYSTAIIASTSDYSQAAIVMRAAGDQVNILQIIQPRNTKLLNKKPELSWQSLGKGYTYRVEVLSADGDSLYLTETQSDSVQIPKTINLPENDLISWEIEATRGTRTHYNSADFIIADDKTAQRIKKAAPKKESFSQLAFYAGMLEKNGFNQDARKYWLKLNRLRPGNDEIQKKIK
ncbi:MAG: hypothetical protein KZQ83_05815 [gamma proteobacterium symbiont of Taylorina sp.]|nr:hypothetical protein [gamma proteobacterium symbiont of Taylorina sp.]